ncbi:MAG: low affinity iron permease family protein [Tepidiformaceae bacterium]
MTAQATARHDHSEPAPATPLKMSERFRVFARGASEVLGSATAFIVAVALVVIWAASGPFLAFSTTWQLLINTTTTVATFLMIFLVQNTQNRDARAIHLKLDELLRSVTEARTAMVDIDDLSDGQLTELRDEFHELAAEEGKPATVSSNNAGGAAPSRPPPL